MDIELGTAVMALRDELVDAAAKGAGEQMEFVVGPIELEFAVELRRDGKVKAGFKAWVVSADTEGAVMRGRTHKMKITMTPRQAGGGDVLVGGDQRRPLGPGDLPGSGEH